MSLPSYQCMYGNAPTYLIQQIPMQSLRSIDPIISTLGQNSALWVTEPSVLLHPAYALHDYLRVPQTNETFKKGLKTDMSRLATVANYNSQPFSQ